MKINLNRRFDLKKIESELMDVHLLPNFPFRNDKWKGHLRESASHFTKEEFIVLSEAIRGSCEDSKIYVVNYELYDSDLPEKESILVEWEVSVDWKDFDRKVQSSPLYTLGIYMWGASQSWGVICTHYDYLMIGGEREFIELFESKLGGYDKLKNEFIQYMAMGGPNIKKDWGSDLIRAFYPNAP